MNPNEPHDFVALAAWLQHVEEKSDSPLLSLVQLPGPHRNPQSVWLSLFQFDNQFSETILQAIETIWLHEAGAFRDLPPDAGLVLMLRIYTARRWIEEFLTSEESPFAYPDGEFQEVVEWLLVHWWTQHGINRASRWLYLRGVEGTTVKATS